MPELWQMTPAAWAIWCSSRASDPSVWRSTVPAATRRGSRDSSPSRSAAVPTSSSGQPAPHKFSIKARHRALGQDLVCQSERLPGWRSRYAEVDSPTPDTGRP